MYTPCCLSGDISTTVITSQLSINDTGTRVRLTPVQLHFHTYSEHTLGGKYHMAIGALWLPHGIPWPAAWVLLFSQWHW